MDCINGTGGISRVNWLVINALNETKYEIFVLGLFKGDSVRYTYKDTIKTSYLFEQQVPNHKRLFKASKMLRKYICDHDFDIIICSGEINFPILALAVAGLDVKVICWEHSNVSVTNEHKFQSICRFSGTVVANKIIALTKKDAQLYKEKFRVKNCVHIYNPIDSRLMKQVHYNAESKRIISVGRLNYQKNFECAVNVAKIVLECYPDWSWDIYGSGNEKEKLQKQIDDFGLNGRIELKGQVDDLYSRYPDYALLVMTSRFEGFPMTLLESTACGLPAIAFDILTGPNEIIDDGISGYLVEFEQVDEMAEKIISLIKNKSIRKQMSQSCVDKRNNFSIEKVVEQWENQLDNI